MKQIFRTKNTEYWLEDNIIRARILGQVDEQDIRDQDKIVLGLFEKIKGKRYGIIEVVDIENVSPIIRKAATITEALKTYDKLAIVYKSSVGRTVASFFIAINKLPCPTKMFKNIENAKKWLKEK